jgi:hypothetical protein
MAKRKDMLKDKLNALNPSIPTSTRGEIETAAQPAPEAMKKMQRNSAMKPKAQAGNQTEVKINIRAKTAEAPQMKTEAKPEPQQTGGRQSDGGKSFTCEYAFIFPALMQANINACNRMRDLMIEQAMNLNIMYVGNYWKSLDVVYKNCKNACDLFTPFKCKF